jgi:hypothetical protein
MSLFLMSFSLPVHFEFFAIFSYCSHFAKFVCMLETAEIETGMHGRRNFKDTNPFMSFSLVILFGVVK